MLDAHFLQVIQLGWNMKCILLNLDMKLRPKILSNISSVVNFGQQIVLFFHSQGD